MKKPYRFACLLACVFVTSCSLLSPVNNEPPNAYVINSTPHNVPHYARGNKTILVATPETRPALNTTQMAYTTKRYQTAYFSQNQWTETPPQMLLPLIVQTLQNTHAYRAVMASPYTGRYDYVLNTQIAQLQQNFTRKPAQLQFALQAQLVSMTTNQVVATKLIIVNQSLRNKTPYNGVIAANLAVEKALRSLAVFCHAHT